MSCLENLPRETKIYSWVNLYSHQSQMRIPEYWGATWRSASWLSGEGKTIFCADLAWSQVFFVAVLKDRRFKWKDFGTEVLLGIIWLKTLCFPHTRHVMVAHGSQGASGCPSCGTSPCHGSLPEEWASESPGGLAKIHVAGLQPQFDSDLGGSQNVHFWQVPMRCCCGWAGPKSTCWIMSALVFS